MVTTLRTECQEKNELISLEGQYYKSAAAALVMTVTLSSLGEITEEVKLPFPLSSSVLKNLNARVNSFLLILLRFPVSPGLS